MVQAQNLMMVNSAALSVLDLSLLQQVAMGEQAPLQRGHQALLSRAQWAVHSQHQPAWMAAQLVVLISLHNGVPWRDAASTTAQTAVRLTPCSRLNQPTRPWSSQLLQQLQGRLISFLRNLACLQT